MHALNNFHVMFSRCSCALLRIHLRVHYYVYAYVRRLWFPLFLILSCCIFVHVCIIVCSHFIPWQTQFRMYLITHAMSLPPRAHYEAGMYIHTRAGGRAGSIIIIISIIHVHCYSLVSFAWVTLRYFAQSSSVDTHTCMHCLRT